MNITITDKAAKEVKRILAEQNLEPDKKAYLRIRIVGGGCSGFSHKLDLDQEITDKDTTLEVNGVNVAVDNRTAIYAEGISIDYHSGLDKSGFVVTNSLAKGTCGCGSSFNM